MAMEPNRREARAAFPSDVVDPPVIAEQTIRLSDETLVHADHSAALHVAAVDGGMDLVVR